MLEVTCSDKAVLGELTGERLRRVEGVQSSRTFQYLELVKLPFTWAGLEEATFGGPDRP